MIARFDIWEGEELCISYKGTKVSRQSFAHRQALTA